MNHVKRNSDQKIYNWQKETEHNTLSRTVSKKLQNCDSIGGSRTEYSFTLKTPFPHQLTDVNFTKLMPTVPHQAWNCTKFQ
jgi:hypothetical protein